MKKIEFWLHRFVFVYGLVMLITFFMCLLFNPTSELPVVRFFGRCILLTLVSMATLIVYASSEELTNRAWWFRTILHAAFLEAILLPLAHRWGFWYNALDGVIYGSFILAAKILWHLIDFGQSFYTATQLNEQIRRESWKNATRRTPQIAKTDWIRCPKCGSKTRTMIREHTVLEDFPLFCPKCKYTCVIRFKDGKIEETVPEKA